MKSHSLWFTPQILLALAALLIGTPRSACAGTLSINAPSPLGPKIELQVQTFDPPLQVSGNQINPNPADPWFDTFQKVRAPYLLTYDQYSDFVTPEFLEMTGQQTRETFEAATAKARAMAATRPPLQSAIVWIATLDTQTGRYLFMAEYPFHLDPSAAIDEKTPLVLTLFKAIDGRWRQDSFRKLNSEGLGLLPWKSRAKLLALANSNAAVIVNKELQPAP